MDYNERVDGNNLLAEFTGMFEQLSGGGYCPKELDDNPFMEWDFSNYYRGICSHLLFHSDWNWLMYVHTKIRKLDVAIQLISNKDSHIHNFGQGYDSNFDFEFLDGEIINVWQAAVNFVKWYNTTKNN